MTCMTRMVNPLRHFVPAPPKWEPLACRETYYEARKAVGLVFRIQEDINK